MTDFEHKQSISRQTAVGGIMALLSVLCLYFSNLMPTGRIFWFLVSTIFISVMVIEFSVRLALITYIASSLLGLILIPNKLIVVPYIIYFGYYGVIKFFIERKNRLIFEWIIKLASYNIALLIFYIFFKEFLAIKISTVIPIYIIFILSQIIFVIYDYCYSIVISYYNNRLRNITRR